MAISFNNFRGVKDLVVAPLTENVSPEGGVTEEYGTVVPLTGIATITSSVEEGEESVYYDNGARIIITSEGKDTYELQVSVPDFANRAILEGKTWDDTKKCYVGTPTDKKYYALGFKAGLTNGEEEYYWIYKGKFTGGDKTFQTTDDGTSSSGLSYTFTSVYTATEYQLTGKKAPAKYAVIGSDHSAAKTFFDTVVTPDKIAVGA